MTGVRWAFQSAVDRSLQEFSEADGHDNALLGNIRYTLFRDRLDRVFSCERYAVRAGDVDADLDQLYDKLSDRDIDTMPRLDPSLVIRSDLSGSPGWVHDGLRFLLASCDYGKIDKLRWDRKSFIKQQVAKQRGPYPLQSTLFEGCPPEELGGLEAVLAASRQLDVPTYVVGHSLSALTQQYELVLGSPQMNGDGGPPWRWRHNLLDGQLAGGGRRGSSTPLPPGPNTEPDASVRLRRPASERRGDHASGNT
nr:hypothetical protein [Kibdelosporangium phytohabitans]